MLKIGLRPAVWAKILVIILLCLSFLDLPYVYYQLLKWVVCGVSAYLAFAASDANNKLVWGFGIVSILFNPVIPFYFKRDAWIVLDIITIALYTYSFRKTNL